MLLQVIRKKQKQKKSSKTFNMLTRFYPTLKRKLPMTNMAVKMDLLLTEQVEVRDLILLAEQVLVIFLVIFLVLLMVEAQEVQMQFERAMILK